jgi:hypothetical protein
MADQEEIEAKRIAVQKALFKNSIFVDVGWFLLIITFLGIQYTTNKLDGFLFFLGWLIIGWPKIWIVIKGGGLGGAINPSYEVVTTYGDGSRSSDGGAQSMQMNLFAKLIQIGLVYLIGGIVQIIHQFVLTIRYIVLHLRAKPKPAFIKSGMFIIVLNIAVLIGAFVVAVTIQKIHWAANSAARGEKTSGDYRYVPNETKDGVILEQYLGAKGGDIIIPATIDGLPVVGLDSSYLFEEDNPTKKGTFGTKHNRKDRITSVVFPDTVTFINGGFEKCTELKQITLPKNIKSIGYGTFKGSGLTSVTIPEGVTDISSNAFQDCKNLTSVTFPRSLERVGERAFENCTSLVNVNIPSGHTIKYGVYLNGEFTADQDYTGSLESNKKAFLGCTSLSAESKQAIKDSGYIGEF